MSAQSKYIWRIATNCTWIGLINCYMPWLATLPEAKWYLLLSCATWEKAHEKCSTLLKHVIRSDIGTITCNPRICQSFFVSLDLTHSACNLAWCFASLARCRKSITVLPGSSAFRWLLLFYLTSSLEAQDQQESASAEVAEELQIVTLLLC